MGRDEGVRLYMHYKPGPFVALSNKPDNHIFAKISGVGGGVWTPGLAPPSLGPRMPSGTTFSTFILLNIHILKLEKYRVPPRRV